MNVALVMKLVSYFAEDVLVKLIKNLKYLNCYVSICSLAVSPSPNGFLMILFNYLCLTTLI